MVGFIVTSSRPAFRRELQTWSASIGIGGRLRPEYALAEPLVVRLSIASRNTIVNTNLKKVAETAKVNTSVSFHIARHSFADYARTSGMDLYSISKALGHSNLTITENYLKSFDNDAVDAGMDDLFSNGGFAS